MKNFTPNIILMGYSSIDRSSVVSVQDSNPVPTDA
jgi:hypothetical protein